jgi:hypothetical protein
MPPLLQGSTYKSKSPTINKNIKYKYPDDLDLTPGSTQHNRIRDEVMQRAYISARTMAGRHDAWNVIDHTLTAYIPADAKEQKVKDQDSRKPISIVFPYSYTVLETLLSFYVAAFLQEPYFRYEGTGPDDVIGAILLEKIIYIQCIKNKVGLALHTQARDAFAYGFGVVTPTWKTDYGSRSVKKVTPGLFGSSFGASTEIVRMPNQLLFEGNALDNIDPYLYLPDVNVPIDQPQKGEYSGWIYPTNYMALLKQEKNDDSMFNVKHLNTLKGTRSSVIASDNSGRNTKSGMSTNDGILNDKTGRVDVIRMYMRIIPKDFGLSDEEYPELWYFEVAQDEIVIRANPANLDHDMFPVSVIAPDFDGYSLSPVSRIEMLNGMQGVLDFMFNSHVANVRKAIHDMIIYDPYMVNSNDLKNPSPGKLIRLRRPAWGRGVKDVAQQLAVGDVTRGNMADSAFLVQWMDRTAGTDSSMQGALRKGGPERLTGTEFEGTRAGGVNRLERIARIVGMQGMQDVGTFFAIHNKQLMSEETYVKVTGDWQEVLLKEYAQQVDRGRVKVNPDQLDVMYDVIVRDGSVPGGNYAAIWKDLFQILGNSPELAQNFDVVRIFTHIARNLGAKNVNDFVRRGGNIQQQTLPNETIEAERQKGNIVPINEAA